MNWFKYIGLRNLIRTSQETEKVASYKDQSVVLQDANIGSLQIPFNVHELALLLGNDN